MNLNKLMSEIKDYNSTWTERQLIHHIEIARALYLRNKLANNFKPSDNVTQTLLDVELEVVDQSEISLFTTHSRILKTKRQIPKFIATSHQNGLLTVRNPRVLNANFNIVEKKAAPYTGNGRGNMRDVFTFLYNGYIYVKLSKDNPKIGLLTTLSIEGLFEQPTEVFSFNKPELENTRELQYEDYPINDSDWLYIKQLILKGDTE